MFFFPIGNLPVEVRENYVNHLVKMNQKAKEDEKKKKELKMYREIISNPRTSLSIKSMMIYSHAIKRIKELEEELNFVQSNPHSQ